MLLKVPNPINIVTVTIHSLSPPLHPSLTNLFSLSSSFFLTKEGNFRTRYVYGYVVIAYEFLASLVTLASRVAFEEEGGWSVDAEELASVAMELFFRGSLVVVYLVVLTLLKYEVQVSPLHSTRNDRLRMMD